jgi:glycine cleavage system transcriptional repressor
VGVNRAVVWTLGADRPGIAAAITGPLFELGCNLEDTSMTILSGQFAMVLVVELPDGIGVVDLERALRAPADRLDLGLAVRAIGPEEAGAAGGEHGVLSVYGADHPGIVHRVVTHLADADVNITDLATRVIGGAADPVYAMVLEVTLPPGLRVADLRDGLTELAAQLGVEASIRAADVDVL